MRFCKYCNEYKDESNFNSRAQCSSCRALKRQEYYKNNRDRLLATQREYDENHVHQKRNRAKKSYLKEKSTGKHIIKTQARRARIASLPNSLKKHEWEIILKAFGYCCAYCGSDKDIEQEHFVPLSKGGEYTKRNIIPACGKCNNTKNSKMPHEFVRQNVIERIFTTQQTYL
jgi:5-methylcytosine-specific restriction endonuclease McrA